MKRDVCEIDDANEALVLRVKESMPEEDEIKRLSDLFKILSEPTRLRIIEALTLDSLCVCELASLLEMTQSAVSHQLRILRSAGIVDYERDGKMARYHLTDRGVADIIENCRNKCL